MKKEIKIIIGIITYLVILFLTYMLFLPSINLTNPASYFYLSIFIFAPIITIILYLLREKIVSYNNKKGKYTYTKKRLKQNGRSVEIIEEVVDIKSKYNFLNLYIKSNILMVGLSIILLLIFSIFGSKMFRAKSYYKQLSIIEETEEEFNNTFSIDNENILIPQIDKDLAFKLAQAKLGDYGSQYEIDKDNFTLISVTNNSKTELVRIAPIDYTNVFVAMSRKNKGSIGYIKVNVVTKESELVIVEEGLKYTSNAILDKDLDRRIRLTNPCEIYKNKFFEIDDDGNPYWVIPTIKKEIGVISGETKKGVIIVNPITGEASKYNIGEEPKWVDRAVDDLVLQNQATNHLKFKNGFLNSSFSKKEVFQVSDGYNYFINNNNTYYVSCITSPNEADQTAVGIVTINLKNGEAKRYNNTGITEMRAREIAMYDERVKAQNLESTWPILTSFNKIPTYFVVLKNDVQGQKYVFINMKDGSMVGMGNTYNEAKIEYERILNNSGSIKRDDLEITGRITRLRDLEKTKEFMIDSVSDKYFVVDINLNLDARFILNSDLVKITYKEYNNYNLVTDIKIIRE